MRVRRCKVLYLEPRQEIEFDLEDLLAGGDGAKRQQRWVALAPHTAREHVVDALSREVLGGLGSEQWVEQVALPESWRSALPALLNAGLVVSDAPEHAGHRESDESLRATHWHPLSALLHGMTRWSDVDSVEAMRKAGTETAEQLRDVLGPPPPERTCHPGSTALISLPRKPAAAFDDLLRRRTTCRNFDRSRPLPLDMTAQLLERVFSAQAAVRVAEDTVFLKKSSPSGGGLHPIEAYLVVRDVDGLEPGLYHYDFLDHALHRLPDPDLPVQELMLRAVAGQQWFADAHAMAIMAPRYARNFWKYRQHAKAYRAVLLEAGHLSQTLYLSATEAGLAAYVTCAINEVCLDEAFGLDPMGEGVLAVCGFGWRAERMDTMELDPLGAIWRS
ncbi:MAG TPA: putative peptide maturation dehydrogenase [Pseudoxanthomonas sp.]|nr:putative peptide maturation dehydrogenase [Pseudoxanthomonas sp.]